MNKQHYFIFSDRVENETTGLLFKPVNRISYKRNLISLLYLNQDTNISGRPTYVYIQYSYRLYRQAAVQRCRPAYMNIIQKFVISLSLPLSLSLPVHVRNNPIMLQMYAVLFQLRYIFQKNIPNILVDAYTLYRFNCVFLSVNGGLHFWANFELIQIPQLNFQVRSTCAGRTVV